MIRVHALLVVIAVCATQAIAAETSQPADANQNEPMRATIVNITGHVQVRMGRDQQWQAAKEQMVLEEGSAVRTGPRSTVQFVIPPDQTITLDRLGTLEIIRANFENGKIMTDLGMKYGRTNYDIDAAGRAARCESPQPRRGAGDSRNACEFI